MENIRTRLKARVDAWRRGREERAEAERVVVEERSAYLTEQLQRREALAKSVHGLGYGVGYALRQPVLVPQSIMIIVPGPKPVETLLRLPFGYRLALTTRSHPRFAIAELTFNIDGYDEDEQLPKDYAVLQYDDQKRENEMQVLARHLGGVFQMQIDVIRTDRLSPFSLPVYGCSLPESSQEGTDAARLAQRSIWEFIPSSEREVSIEAI